MKLKFFIAGLAVVAGLASAVSCQDLTKDLTDLKSKVASLESTVQALQSKIDAGAVITSVTPSNSGIKITLSNGNSYDITNGVNGKDGANGKDGKDGAPGSVVTIGENGNWFIDGEDTGLAAEGVDGEDGTPGAFFVPNPLTGCFDMYVWDDEKGEYVATPTEIPFIAEGTITAVYNTLTNTLTLYGVVDENGDVIEGGVVIGAKGAEAVTEITIQQLPAAALPYNFFSVKQLVNDAFGPNGEITFEEEELIERPLVYVIKVNPVSAKLSDEDVQFVNSKGDVLDMLDITVEEYDDILVKSGNTGLYKVTASLKEYNKEAFEKATKTATGLINFAIKVGDAVSDFESKFGRSDNWAPANPFSATSPAAGRIMIAGGENTAQNITALRNRNGENDYKWTAAPKVQSAIVKSGASANVVKDSRTGGAYLKVAVDEPIVISATTNEYRAFYVTLDSENVTDPSETVAWDSYDITGLNTLCYDGKLTITVSSAEAKDDVIGFRVYAVNWNGTFASPYGTAFYAIMSADASDPGEETKPIETVITPKYNGDYGAIWSATAAFDPKSVPGKPVFASATFTPDVMLHTDGVTNMNEGFKVRFVDNKGNATTNATQIVGIQTQPTSTKAAKWGVYVNNMEYTGVLSIPNADGVILAKIPVSMKKVLPTVAPDAIKKAWNLRSGVLDASNTYVFEVDNKYTTTDAKTIYGLVRGATNGRLRDYKVKQHAVDAAIAAGTDPTAAQLQTAATAGLYYYYSSYDQIDLSKLYTFTLPTAAEDPVFGGNIAIADYSTKFEGAYAYEIFNSTTGANVTNHSQTATTPTVASGEEGALVDLVVAGTNTANIGIAAVNNQKAKAKVSYNYGAISLGKFGGTPAPYSCPVDEFDYQFRTKAATYEWKWNWNAIGVSTASNADINIAAASNDTGVAYTLAANAGITGSANWDVLAPAHQARLNYIYYSVTQKDGGVVTDYIKNYENWKPASGSGTGGAYTAADWRKDPFDVNMAPELLFTTAFTWDAFADWIYDENSKTKLSAVMDGNARGEMFLPDDFAAAHYWGDYDDTGAEKAIEFRPATLTSALGEEYYEASVSTVTLTLNPVTTATAPLSTVNSKLTLNLFDEYDNMYTIVVDVKIVP